MGDKTKLNELLAIAGSALATASARKTAWEDIHVSLGKDSSLLANDLAAKLQTHPITVRRWMNGENVPRTSMMIGIRALVLGETDSNAFDHSNPLSVFDASHAAIWTLDRYLELLPDAKAAFIFKSRIEMHAANNARVLNLVQKAFDSNDRLTVYYVVVEATKAEESYEQLEELIKIRVGSDAGLLGRLRKIKVTLDQDLVGVGKGLPSPFVVLFNKSAWHMRQHLAILYEVPVALLDADGQECESKTALIQLPISAADRLWKQWGPEISKMGYRAADGAEGSIPGKDWKYDEE